MDTTIIALNALLTTVKDVAKNMNEEGTAAAAKALRILGIGTVGGIAAGLFLGWLIARFLSRNLANVVRAAQAIGGGNLSARSSVTTTDEGGVLARGFNEMGETLQAKATAEQAQRATMDQFLVEAKRVLTNLAQGDLTDQGEVASRDIDVLCLPSRFQPCRRVGVAGRVIGPPSRVAIGAGDRHGLASEEGAELF
jgi:HAMP domain-containing protein